MLDFVNEIEITMECFYLRTNTYLDYIVKPAERYEFYMAHQLEFHLCAHHCVLYLFSWEFIRFNVRLSSQFNHNYVKSSLLFLFMDKPRQSKFDRKY